MASVETGQIAIAEWRQPARRARLLALAAATLGMGAAYGGLGTIGVMIIPLETEFGWLRGDIATGYVLMAIGSAVGGLFAGRMSDRLPAGPIAAFGTAVLGIGMILLSMQSRLEAMLVIYLGVGLFGFSCLYSPLLASIARWFPGRGGVAFGIVTAGGAVGQAVVPPLLQLWIIEFGWRDSYALMGVMYLLLISPLMLFASAPRAPLGTCRLSNAVSSAPQLPVSPVISIALLCLAGLLCCNLMGVPTVHLVSLAVQQGLAPAAAGGVMTTTMIAACVGRVATGLVVDRVGALPAYALLSVVQTVGVACFPFAGDAASLHLVGIVYGLGFGGVMTGLVCSVRDAVAPRNVGLAMAVVGLLAWVGMASGGYQGGICFDITGSYDLSFAAAALAGLANVASICVLMVLARRDQAPASILPTPQRLAQAAYTPLNGSSVSRTALRTASTSGAA